MLTFYKQFKLTNKLALLVFIVILTSFGVLAFYFDTFLKESYFQSTKKRMLHGYQLIASNLARTDDGLKKGIAFVQTDEKFLASIDLINNYQDKENYNAILLDEEKKILAEQLLDRVKLSLNNDIAVYDKHEELIAFVRKADRGYHLNFISYENNQKILYSKFEHDDSYTKASFQEYKLMGFKHADFYKNKQPTNFSVITYHSFKDEIFIKSHQNITSGNTDTIIAHIEMSHLLDSTYFSELSNNLDMIIIPSRDEKYASYARPLFNDNDALNIRQTTDDYIGSMSIDTLNDTVYLLARLQKSSLKATLNDNRNKVFLILLIVSLSILILLRFLFSRGLAEPLNRLMQQINKIEHRDYSYSKQLSSGDELETISKNINNLASTIRIRESALKKSQENLKHISNHDHLTNLPNRRFFSMRLEHALDLSNRNQTKVVLLFLDLDKFKDINDSLGHDIGDELLKAVSKRLASSIRSSDTLARIGGDEFNILIENIHNVSEVENILQKILDDFQSPFLCHHHELLTTVSIGVTVYPYDGNDKVTLSKNADLAMYKAKEIEGNSFNFFSRELADGMEDRMNRIGALKEAIATCDEFFLLYQPKISLHTGKIIAIEALIRWHSSKLGLINPDQFIPLAEETNLIVPLGRWVLQQACNDFMKLQEQGYTLEQVSINISSIQLLKSDMLQTLKQTLDLTGIQAHQMELEITETYIATNEQKVLKTLQDFRDLNVNLAIDDFGTGYSSLSYLHKLPVTRLKIDKSFVDNIPESDESIAIAKSIIALAKTFNLGITAEGVETEAQLSFLKNVQCDEAQGYYFARPLSIKELKLFYSNMK